MKVSDMLAAIEARDGKPVAVTEPKGSCTIWIVATPKRMWYGSTRKTAIMAAYKQWENTADD